MVKNTILDYFEDTVLHFPERVAFSDLNETISYAELERQGKFFASNLLLRKNNAEVVAFYMDKSVKTIIGFIGSIYAGCAYTQINLRYPCERIKSMVETVSPCIIVVNIENYDKVADFQDEKVQVILYDDLFSTDINCSMLENIRKSLTDLQPLYINFTSGSTGKPKGVVVGHRSVIDFISNFVSIFKITENDVIANQAPFDFDVSVKDIYSALFTGACVQIVPTQYFINPTNLMDFLCDRKVTVLIWAVSALCFITTMHGLEYRCPESIRIVMFSGEVMPVKHLNILRHHLKSSEFVNLFGPTEITCNCTYYVVNREYSNDERLPIGIPFPNEKVFILDENDKLISTSGVIGELCVSGSSLALGYYKDREKTDSVFMQNPLNNKFHEMIYRTGDLVEIGQDGLLYYLSRKDFQIKHLGHRIELTEIETVIDAVDGVDRACCFFDEKKDRIYAVYTGECNINQIKQYLSVRLPSYMFPQHYYKIESFPLNKNGKIDRKQLEMTFLVEEGVRQ